jgi:Outer membrane protein beta-barrel domain
LKPLLTIKLEILALVSLAALFLPGIASAIDKNQLSIGADLGYVATFRESGDQPPIVDGAAFGLHLEYGFDNTWGLRVEGNFDWHPDYGTIVVGEIVSPEGEAEAGYLAGPSVTDCYLSATAISLVYNLDVMRVVPFLSLGVVGARVDQKENSVQTTNWELGIRMSIGADYMFLDYLGLGGILVSDQFFFGESDYENRMAVMARLTFFFDLSSGSLAKMDDNSTMEP